MNGTVRTSFLFCFLLAKVFGQEQFHGFFKFIGNQNSPETSLVTDQSFNKSMRECSSKCLKEDNCYFFDICKNGSLTSCYFYDNNVSSSASVDSGACRRYELVKKKFFNFFLSKNGKMVKKIIMSENLLTNKIVALLYKLNIFLKNSFIKCLFKIITL